jgi:precorrin-4/cobalt-precorrin-4 C11-methyltransferase
MTLEEVTAVFEAHPEAAIVRLHSGDPTVYSAIAEQIAWCVAHGRDFEIVPAVGSLSAAAAAAGHELTVPALSQAVVLTRLADRTRASMPPGQSVADLAGHGVTMAVYLSAGRPDALQAALLEGYPPETPALLAYRVSWPDQQLVRTTVGKVAASLRALAATTTVLVLVGPALAEAEPPARSHVYDPGYSHSFRSA